MSETESVGIDGTPFGRWMDGARGVFQSRPQVDMVTVWAAPDGSDRYVLQVIEKGVTANAVLPAAQAAHIAHLLTAGKADEPAATPAPAFPPPPDDWPAAAEATPWWCDLAIWGAAIGAGLALGIALSKIVLG
jgi:hypothetical protein